MSGLCAAAPSIKERCGSNATITSRSSFIGPKGHEMQVTIASCPDRANRRAIADSVELNATCLPDPSTCFVSSCLGSAQPPTFVSDCKTLLASVAAFAPTFAVLENQVIFIIFNTCQLDFGVGPQTTDICGTNWASVAANILSRCPNLAGGEAPCNSGLYDINIIPNQLCG